MHPGALWSDVVPTLSSRVVAFVAAGTRVCTTRVAGTEPGSGTLQHKCKHRTHRHQTVSRQHSVAVQHCCRTPHPVRAVFELASCTCATVPARGLTLWGLALLAWNGAPLVGPLVACGSRGGAGSQGWWVGCHKLADRLLWEMRFACSCGRSGASTCQPAAANPPVNCSVTVAPAAHQLGSTGTRLSWWHRGWGSMCHVGRGRSCHPGARPHSSSLGGRSHTAPPAAEGKHGLLRTLLAAPSRRQRCITANRPLSSQDVNR